jgi:nicotinic acid mononucleotide adenylyltransferase
VLERARDYIEKTLGQRVLEGVISPISKAFGQSNLVANEHRIQMLELATRSSDWIRFVFCEKY